MQHELSPADNGKTIAVVVGDTILIQLEENPTTGYAWAVEEEAQDEILQLEESNYEVFTSAGIGGGGNRTFRFTIKQSGKGRLQLKYWQRWSGDVNKRLSFDIQSN